MSTTHLLTLKVLRLSKPSFSTKEEPELIEEDLNNVETTDFLSLPAAFGNIYLGETFSSYLCVNNDSLTSVQNVAFKAELQTASQRFTLADTIGTASPVNSNANLSPRRTSVSDVSLLPRQSSEFILHHEIKELGIHILVCSVHYSPQTKSTTMDRKFFRKFFKFQVLNPLSVKTKANTLDNGKINLEIQLSNLATLPLFLNNVNYEVDESFDVQDMNYINKNGEITSVFPTKIIQPLDTRQYLFLLTPKEDMEIHARTNPNLGRLDLRWSTTLGQVGHLQTSQLTRKIPTIQQCQLSIVKIPEIIKTQEAFKLTLRVRNNLSEVMKLSLKSNLKEMEGVYLQGESEMEIGVVDGQTWKEFEVLLFALVAGAIDIKGLSLFDFYSKTMIPVKLDTLNIK